MWSLQLKNYQNKWSIVILRYLNFLMVRISLWTIILGKNETGNETDREIESFSDDDDQDINPKKIMQTPKNINGNSKIVEFLQMPNFKESFDL